MWHKRDPNKMGMRTSQRQLEETIQKKREDKSVSKILLDKLTELANQVKGLRKEVKDIKNREVVVTVENDTEKKKPEQKTKNLFIPSLDTDSMKVSAGNVQKRTRKTNLTGSVEKLQKLDN